MKALSLATPTRRVVYAVLGCCSVALGLAGVFLPGLPTTESVIAASYLFARNSPRFEGWLRSNRWLGPRLQRYRDWGGGMPRSAKHAVLISMRTSVALSSIVLARISISGLIVTVALGTVGTSTILCLVRSIPVPAITPKPPDRVPTPAAGWVFRSIGRK